MILNDAGRMVEKCWQDIPEHFPHVELDEWVIMPNHIHGIVSITMNGGTCRGEKFFAPTCDIRDAHTNDAVHHQPCGTSKTIGSIVRGFKIGVTEWVRQNTTEYDVWQRNYWEHIIRNETALENIRVYIRNNPKIWYEDRLNDRRVNGNG